MRNWWRDPGTTRWAILIRLSLAFVFVFEGYQKLAFPAQLGAGRFAKIGIPVPEMTGPFIGVVELVCGLMLLVGFWARAAAVPLIATMVVALLSTKLPIWLGRDWWIFSVRDLDRYGFLSMTHEARTDVAMLLESLFILFAGAGRWSIDALQWRHGSRSGGRR